MDSISLLWLIVASTALQCISFIGITITAFRRQHLHWFLFSVAFGLMAFRRLLSLWIHIRVTDMTTVSSPPELVAFMISVALASAVILENWRNG